MRLRRARAAWGVALAVLASCEHAKPFGPADLGPNQPYSAGFPRRLTFNLLGDVQPAWLPADSGIIYSVSMAGATNDHCLGILPPGGGHLERTICHPPSPGGDSTTALWVPAVSPAGYLAYVREVSRPGALAPDSTALVLASLTVPDPGRVLLRLPYTAPDGTLQSGLRDLRWLHEGTLVFLGGTVGYSFPPYPWDTTFTPTEIMRLNVGGDSTQPTVVPGTIGATSLATDSSDALYYTLAGDSRVYRRLEGAPSATVWYDFGAAGPASDLQVSGSVLVAVAGGEPYRVNVVTGSRVAIPWPGSLALGRVALSRDGTRLAAEGTGAGAFPDLWLLEVP